MSMNLADDFETALLALDRVRAAAIAHDAVAQNGVTAFFDTLVRPVLERMGTAWERGDLALSQIYMAGRISEELIDVLVPAGAAPLPPRGEGCRVGLCVLEDYHLLGKRLVGSALSATGQAYMDYGTQTVDGLVERVVSDSLDILLVSTLMLPSALRVGVLTAKLRAAAPDTRVVVGGAPFRLDEELWREVGAAACGRTASDAMSIITRLQAERGPS